jgi:hypothetical protein
MLVPPVRAINLPVINGKVVGWGMVALFGLSFVFLGVDKRLPANFGSPPFIRGALGRGDRKRHQRTRSKTRRTSLS